MDFGIDIFLTDKALQRKYFGKRVALLGHPASVTKSGIHSLTALSMLPGLTLSAAFGPQHGIRGDKQDNMIETESFIDPELNIPVYSLYGEVRRPTQEMCDSFDVILIDLQDIGTRIYTYVTTLLYVLEAAAQHSKTVVVLDRPNPAGRPIEGSFLESGWESFVGAAPLMMRHGLTLAELAQWFIQEKKLSVDLHIVPMQGYLPDAAPGFGWPMGERAWVNPSPNASSLNMARVFPGTVLFEGTHLSEGRGTTTALELIGAPDIDFTKVLKKMEALEPSWLKGVFIRPCYFEPTFHKHQGKLCSGIQLHTDGSHYLHEEFKPYRLSALLLKAVRTLYPEYQIWRDFAYEYETTRLAIDLLSGGSFLREWVDNPKSSTGDLDAKLTADEKAWGEQRKLFLLY